MELLVLHSDERLNDKAFLEIYKQSSLENALKWYPTLSSDGALEKYEKSFLDYIHGEFWRENGILFILKDDTIYRSGLRLYHLKNGSYHIEALETRPDSRKMGYAKQLLMNVIETIRSQNNTFTLKSCVHKKISQV